MPDSNSILYLAGDRGSLTIYRVDVSSLQIKLFMLPVDAAGHVYGTFTSSRESYIEPDSPYAAFQISNFSISRRLISIGTPDIGNDYPPIAFTLSDEVSPAELYVAAGKGVNVVRTSAHNEAIRSMQLVPSARINFKSFDGTAVQGWLVKPLGWRSDRKYPLILSIHGGPHGMSGYGFNPAFQVYAARGYAVLYLNPRGSSGYGQ